MAGRTLAQMVGLDAPTTEDAPAAMWGWIECGCGSVFYGPATRRRCMTCRTGAVVVREVEDDEEGQEDMRGRQLGLDEEEVRTAFASGMPAAEVCRKSKVSASQFAHWCYRNRLKFPGVPTPSTAAVAALQAEIDRLTLMAPSGEDSQWHREAPKGATTDVHAPAVGDKTQDAMAAFSRADAGTLRMGGGKVAVAVSDVGPGAEPLPDPFRAAVREGGLILPLRVEGTRIIVVDDWMVDGDITDVEAELALGWLRDRLQGRKGVEVVVEPCSA